MNEDFYIDLIQKRLSGSISREESAQLEAWIQASDSNAELAKDMELVWNTSGSTSAQPKVDLDVEFGFLEDRIAASEPKAEIATPIRKPEPQRRTFYYVLAACLALLVSLGVYRFMVPAEVGPGNWIEVAALSEKKVIELNDGSVVTLEPGSSLSYPEKFALDARSLKLKGEAFFSVKPDPNRPFSIATSKEIVTVLGTEFKVMADEEKTYVHVASGKVEVKLTDGSAKQVLEKGDLAISNGGEILTYEGNEANSFSSTTHILVFENTPLSKVLEDVGAVYEVQLSLENPALSQCPFTSTFKDQPFEVVLETLTIVFGLEVVEKEGSPVLLIGGACE